MKKSLSWLLIAALLLALAACGAGTAGGKKVGVFYYSFDDAFLSNVRIALNDEFALRRIEFENFDAANHQETQYAQIRAAVAEGCRVLLVNMVVSNDPDAAREILRLAGGVPVVFFNRSIEKPNAGPEVLRENGNALFVGTPSGDAGHMQGALIGEYVTANFDKLDRNGDGELTYAMLKGSEDSNECVLRTRYSVENANAALAAAGRAPLRYFDPASSVLYQVDPENKWSDDAAFAFLSEDLKSFNDANGSMIELVICNNDDMAVGAIAALQSAGYNQKHPDRTIPVFGIDATAVACELISEGLMAGTVRQDSNSMALGMAEVAERLLSGAKAPEAVAAAAKLDKTFSVGKDSPQKLVLAYTPYGG